MAGWRSNDTTFRLHQFKTVIGCAFVGILLIWVMVGNSIGRMIVGGVVGGALGFWLSRPLRVQPTLESTPDIPVESIEIRQFRSRDLPLIAIRPETKLEVDGDKQG